jgi:hypothetical protein
MSTSYRSPLGVSFGIPRVSSVRRTAELFHYPAGYSVVRFTGEREIVSTDVRESIRDLLKLVPPPRAMTVEEMAWVTSLEERRIGSLSVEDDRRLIELQFAKGGLVRVDIAPEAIVRFINRWGLIGLLNHLGDQVLVAKTPYLSSLLNIGIPYYVDDSKIKRKDLKAIQSRSEIPISWIEDALYRLARMTRLTMLLFSSDAIKKSSVDLEIKTRKRLLSAWNEFPFTFTDAEDPGDNRFKLDKRWLIAPNGRPTLLDKDLCQTVLSEFASDMNFYIQPISSHALLTDSFEEMTLNSSSYEPAIASYLLSFWSDQSRTLFRCDECQNLYRPERVKRDHRFCGTSCKERFNKRKYRQKKRAESQLISIPPKTK